MEDQSLSTPETVVQRQATAYSNRGIEELTSDYAKQTKIIRPTNGAVIVEGRNKIQDEYGPYSNRYPTCMPRRLRGSLLTTMLLPKNGS